MPEPLLFTLSRTSGVILLQEVIMFRNILVPFDFGEASERALEIAMSLMGTHGRRGIPHAILGSVAEKVVRLSKVPVLTLHAATS
jgi:nucleotide-binding universal stress UspA family protein